MPDYIAQPGPRPGRGQSFENEAKSLRPRPSFWPRGHFGFEDLSLQTGNYIKIKPLRDCSQDFSSIKSQKASAEGPRIKATGPRAGTVTRGGAVRRQMVVTFNCVGSLLFRQSYVVYCSSQKKRFFFLRKHVCFVAIFC